jgi:hypothetical protein
MSRIKCALGLAALAVSASAEAGVVTTSSQSAFNIITSSRAYVRESFAFNAPGAYSTLAGGTAWNAWTMTAGSGGLDVAGGRARAADAGAAITITFAPGSVFGVGGNFFMSDAAGGPASQVRIALASGQSYVANSSSTSFAGFVSTEAITSITIQRQVAGADAQYATVGGLVVAGVPAPGSVALLAAAGLAGSRKRRR